MKTTAMRNLFICLLAFLVACTLSSRAAVPEEDTIMVPIQKFFDGIAHRSATEMKASAVPGAPMLIMRDGEPTQLPI